MNARSRPRLLLAGALLFGAPPHRAVGDDGDGFVQLAPIWLTPAAPAAGRPAARLLSLPAGWAAGDAIAVLAMAGTERSRLRSALLEAGAGVMEIASSSGSDFAPALRAALEEAGAGIVVALAHGADAEAIFEAAAAASAPNGQSYSAVILLGPGRARLAWRAAAPGEAWPARAALLCDVIEAALGKAGASPGAACRASLSGLR